MAQARVFVGPMGWIVLAVLSRSAGERLAVKMPWSDAAYDRFTDARRRRNRTAALGLLVVAIVLLGAAAGGMGPAGLPLVVAAAAGLVTAHVAADRRLAGASVGVSLDA